MIYIKLPESLNKTSPRDKRNTITSDETWAFTQQPRKNIKGMDGDGITVHDLFNLFTANIIKEDTLFTR